MPQPTTASVDEFVEGNPRDSGFAGALARDFAINHAGQTQAAAQPAGERIYRVAQGDQPPPRGMDQVHARPGDGSAAGVVAAKGQAKATWDRLVNQKVQAKLAEIRAYKPKATIDAVTLARLKEAVAAENPDLYAQMLNEANEAARRRDRR
ncbi:MAG: hypothetical protein ACREHD_32380 [Pirellulales bacterium]